MNVHADHSISSVHCCSAAQRQASVGRLVKPEGEALLYSCKEQLPRTWISLAPARQCPASVCPRPSLLQRLLPGQWSLRVGAGLPESVDVPVPLVNEPW